jgi:hypothetical protein
MIEIEGLTRRFGEVTAVDGLPAVAIYVLAEIGTIALDLPTLAVEAGILAAVDIAMAFASRATFRREEILTRWA